MARELGKELVKLTVCKLAALTLLLLVLGFGVVPQLSGRYGKAWEPISSNSRYSNTQGRFLEVPQIVWGLNNQKIAFARACLTARFLNRTLLMPSLSASLFYKEVDLLQRISFDKVFKFDKFNSLCRGFVQVGRYSDVTNKSKPLEQLKGSGRRWTPERDLALLKLYKEPPYDTHEVIQIKGKNPFLWPDHWPVKDYARVFGCLEFVDEILDEATKVISKIRQAGGNVNVPYVAVHMRIEKDWMIHCRNYEKKLGINQICSSREEIMERVGRIPGLPEPTIVYLAVADALLEDGSILNGWKVGILPLEKKKLHVLDMYKRHPYLLQSAIDFEVCSRADVFVGNSFSTFSSLVVLERTQRMIKEGVTEICGVDARLPSFAYNVKDDNGVGPRKWMTNLADGSLQALSYGSINISCSSFFGAQE